MMITITAKEGNKIIEQFDVDLPSWAKWIAQDVNGLYCAYAHTPICDNNHQWYELYGKYQDANVIVLVRGNKNPDWRDTLIKVSNIK